MIQMLTSVLSYFVQLWLIFIYRYVGKWVDMIKNTDVNSQVLQESRQSNVCLFMQNKVTQSYAPFGSASSKNAKKKKNLLLQPGPGAYQVSLPLITPIVQTIRKSNNNVIVKLGHLGTAPFLAGGQRFHEKIIKDALGPGAYQKTERQKLEKVEVKKQRQYAAQKLRDILKSPIETVPTITQIKKVTFDDEVQMPNQKNKKNRKDKVGNFKGLNWSRMSEQRDLATENSLSHLGPGSYDIQPLRQLKKLEKQPSSSFNSNSVRSFFDRIIFETNQDGKARQRQERKYKSDMIGPGSYDVQGKKQKKYKYQFFGSTQQRP